MKITDQQHLNLALACRAAKGYGLRPRNGKVARLPEATRNSINEMLDDGVRYRDIIDKLQRSGAGLLPYSISEMNLSNWFRGGYQEWCRKRFEDRFRRELARRCFEPDDPARNQTSPNYSI
jgi:hypothetical protein